MDLPAIVILNLMSPARTLPLFDPRARPQSWNERMAPGEYATLYSNLQVGSDPNRPTEDGPFCPVFSSLEEAEQDAQRQVVLLPALCCRIYDHHGLGRQPIREICGKEYKGEESLSGRFRRGWGYSLLAGGVVLTIVDWRADWALLWPAMFGTRMIPAGLFLLGTDLIIHIEAKRRQRRAPKQ
jgi:hypothetical protein